MPDLPICAPRHLLLALLVAGSSVLAAALPKVTFDARALGERADTRTWPAEEYPLDFKAPRHIGVTLGPKDEGSSVQTAASYWSNYFPSDPAIRPPCGSLYRALGGNVMNP